MSSLLKNMEDPYAWSKETAEALRAGDFSRIDLDALTNEVESVGSGIIRELIELLTEAIDSLLMMSYSSDARLKAEAALHLNTVRANMKMLFSTAPSVRADLNEAIEEAYTYAREIARQDFSTPLPETCPFPPESILP